MTIAEIINSLNKNWGTPTHALHRGEEIFFTLACRFSLAGIKPARDYPFNVPDDIKEFWSIAESAELFKDVEYGQWGLEILSPAESLAETASQKKARRGTYRSKDLIIGRFIGDSERLVLSCGESQEYGIVRVALPIDPYPDWYVAANSFGAFLEQYAAMQGDKFWEK